MLFARITPAFIARVADPTTRICSLVLWLKLAANNDTSYSATARAGGHRLPICDASDLKGEERLRFSSPPSITRLEQSGASGVCERELFLSARVNGIGGSAERKVASPRRDRPTIRRRVDTVLATT